MKTAEGLHCSLREGRIHSEGFAGPIHRAAHKALGVVNSLVVFVFPVPNELGELFAPEIKPGLLLLLPQHLFHHGLGADSGMITTRQPKSNEAPVAVSSAYPKRC